MLAVLGVLTGCATGRSQVDVNFSPTDALQKTAPANGKKVLISTIDDRVFKVDPRSSEAPSLKGDEVANKSLTERGIGRKRNGYGQGLGDVVLPSGRTVPQLVSQAVSAAYKSAGYEVVTDKSANDVTAVNVHIVEFWSWFSPGILSVTISNKAFLRVETAGAPDIDVLTRTSDNVQVVTDSDWKAITESGLKNIALEMRKQL
ncbi:YajG family lipoprotein [Pseudomonas capsici]|uniref:flagellar biosynthesis protein n=1 Tax=Pseudomonas capsici TaxID=2810614 RepID=UPI0021F12E5E|nr:flagellar biosynthesis protein [Pseudomonas capsici]MCV4264195.1 flagellar biosynthesis protein [Pseudomonas capsici]